MESILCQKATAFPDAIAIMDGETSYTYPELIQRADILAKKLIHEEIHRQEPVCIFLESGSRQIISQVAVLRAGGTCVPIDPSMPDIRLKEMLRDIGCQHVITNKTLRNRLSSFEITLVEDATEYTIDTNRINVCPVRAGCSETHRSHLLFTSGSTGSPKAVQISASSILHLLTSTPVTPLSPSDRMGGFVNPGFDISLFEIWCALLSGATIVTIPKSIVTDPVAIGDFLNEWKITIMIIPTALFNVIALHSPSSFHNLRHALIVGEAANINAMQKTLTHGPPQHLWNAYGPTETTAFSTLQLVTKEETRRERISIGEGVGQTRLFLLDHNRRPVFHADEPGEICIAGPGVSPGYLNRLDANNRFICLEDTTTPIRAYRTGDIGQWRVPLKSLDSIGRADKQIKLSGYRIELGDIERTLERNDHIKATVVLHDKQDGSPGSDRLVGFVIPISGENPGSKDLITWATEQLPFYMVPGRVKYLQTFPLTNNGKVDREALRSSYQDEPREKKRTEQEPRTQKRFQYEAEDPIPWLKSTLHAILGVPISKRNDDIFALGLTSLKAAQFIGRIRQDLGLTVTMQALHAHPTLGALLDLLGQCSTFSKDPMQTSKMEDDAHLADGVPIQNNLPPDTEGQIFITGVTGFLGAHLLQSLLAMPNVKKVACLARSHDQISAMDRIQATLEKYDLWDISSEQKHKIIVIDGDLSDETLGMGEKRFTWFANWASVVFHVGAKVNWCEPYESHFDSNILGTRNIIRLAASGHVKPLHYVSSIDSWNVTGLVLGTKSVTEDGPLGPHLESSQYDTGYAQSQWTSEGMVRRARDRGLPVAIHRPGFIIGDSKHAAGNPDDFFSRFVIGCIKLGYWPELIDLRLEYVTVDYICSAILHIASQNASPGQSYSLVSPDRAQSVSMEETCNLLNKAGYSVQQIPYEEWIEKLRKNPVESLMPLMPLLEERVWHGFTRLQTSQYTPVYEATNKVHALRQSGIKYIPLDHMLLRQKIDFWQRKGFYTLC